MLDSSLDAIVMVDDHGAIVEFNPAAERTFGRTRSDVLGEQMAELLIPPSLREDHHRGFDHFLATGEGPILGKRLELSALRADGSEFPVELAITKVPSDGPPLFTGYLRDLTEQRQLEEQLRRAQRMETVGRLAGGVAHEFNNLLQAITGYSDLASAEVGADQPELRRSIDQIKAAATLAAALTGKLLAFSRQQVVQPRVVDLSAMVEELAAMVRPLLEERINLILELEPAGTSVEADPGQLELVVMSLVINARDAMPDGGQVTITVATLDVTEPSGSRPLAPGRYVRLAVSDTGTGMDEETISRAFDPFFTTKEPGEGTGLGLSTVHGIVTQSGGDVQITSAPGEGTTFDIYLPSTKAAGQEPTSESSPQGAVGGETILLVEDQDAVRTVLRKILKRNGFEVIVAGSGAEAIESTRALGKPVDLLVTDLVMPGMNGRDLSRELVALYPGLRVIYMSGHTEDEALHEEIEAGRADFLQKPFSAITLVESARKVLGGPAKDAAKPS
jgi:two-component system cell cycle sensor histidine kinase/response regulator CckA